MKDLKTRITENGIDYVLVGDYYIPDLKLPEEKRSIGKWGRMHREYLKKQCYGRYSSLLLTGKKKLIYTGNRFPPVRKLCFRSGCGEAMESGGVHPICHRA